MEGMITGSAAERDTVTLDELAQTMARLRKEMGAFVLGNLGEYPVQDVSALPSIVRNLLKELDTFHGNYAAEFQQYVDFLHNE